MKGTLSTCTPGMNGSDAGTGCHTVSQGCREQHWHPWHISVHEDDRPLSPPPDRTCWCPLRSAELLAFSPGWVHSCSIPIDGYPGDLRLRADSWVITEENRSGQVPDLPALQSDVDPVACSSGVDPIPGMPEAAPTSLLGQNGRSGVASRVRSRRHAPQDACPLLGQNGRPAGRLPASISSTPDLLALASLG